MSDEFTPEQVRRIRDIVESTVRHELANLGIGTADGEPRQTTQRNVWTLWQMASDYQTDTAAAIRRWVFERFQEWDTPTAQKHRQHVQESMERAEKRRENWSKAVYGILGAVAVAVVMAIIAHAGTIFSGIGK